MLGHLFLPHRPDQAHLLEAAILTHVMHPWGLPSDPQVAQMSSLDFDSRGCWSTGAAPGAGCPSHAVNNLLLLLSPVSLSHSLIHLRNITESSLCVMKYTWEREEREGEEGLGDVYHSVTSFQGEGPFKAQTVREAFGATPSRKTAFLHLSNPLVLQTSGHWLSVTLCSVHLFCLRCWFIYLEEGNKPLPKWF